MAEPSCYLRHSEDIQMHRDAYGANYSYLLLISFACVYKVESAFEYRR